MERWVTSSGRLLAEFTGAVGVSVFDFLYGEGDITRALMIALLFFAIMDWISGIRSAKKDLTYASKYGIDGVFRSFFILLLPAGGNLLDTVLGT